MNIETANRLYEYRKKNHLSQEELAEKIGVSRQAISKWERAEASPDTDNLLLLADVYNVSLDELLRGCSDKAENDSKSSENTDDCACNDAGSKENKEKPKVSFVNGIHVHDGEDHVDISFKDGVHVNTKDGTKVSIDKNGIFVDENGTQKVYTDENGHVVKSKDIIDEEKKHSNPWMKFPFPVFAAILYLCFGFLDICGGWAFGWIVFLLIPIYYTLVEAIIKRNPKIFCYPIITVIIFMALGFFFNLWHPAWIIFLTIPLYYWAIDSFKKER